MTTSAYQREYPIPPAFPAILKGFARETLRAQPQDIYKFAAQYFAELQQSNPGPTADSNEEKAARLQADLLQHFLNADRNNRGSLSFNAFSQAIRTRALSLSSRQIRVAIANCDVSPEGLVEYRSAVPLLSKLLLKAKEVDESPFSDAHPDILRGLSSTDVEQRFVQAFSGSDPTSQGFVSRQAFKAALQSPDLMLCRKDVNTILGELDAEQSTLDYQSIAPEVFELLSTRLADEAAINDDLSSHSALKDCLMRLAQQQDPQDTGIMSWDKLLQLLQKLSQDYLGFSAIDLACMLGYAAQDAAQVMQYGQAIPKLASVILTHVNVKAARTRLAAMSEFQQKDASGKRFGNEQTVKKCLRQAFEEEDKTGGGTLQLQECQAVIQSLTRDMLQLTSQEVVALRMMLQQCFTGTVDGEGFVEQTYNTLTHLDEEFYVQSYIQAHT